MNSDASVLLIGKDGQLGRELCKSLLRLGHICEIGREQLDLSNKDGIRKLIRSIRPEIIVNSAAYTNVEQAEGHEDLATAINGEAPGVIAEEAQATHALFVHFSTDYVFDGTSKSPYVETDLPAPLNAYGRTKLAGERAIRASGCRHLIFRTAWVYSTGRENFLLKFLRRAASQEEVEVVQDQIGSPTSSHDLAAAAAEVLSVIQAADHGVQDGISGIYHMTALGQVSWYGFAAEILAEIRRRAPCGLWFQKAIDHRSVIASIKPINSNQLTSKVQRPAYSVLSNARLADVFGVSLPDWKTQLHSLLGRGAPRES